MENKKKPKVIQLDLKAHHYTAFNDVKIVYQFVDRHKGRGRKPITASTFICDTFRTWDPSLTPDLADAKVQSLTVKKMLESHNIKSMDDLYVALSTTPDTEIPDLPMCGRRAVRLNLSNPVDAQLYEILKKQHEKARAFIIYVFVKNYIAREEPEEFFEIAAARLWGQLVTLYLEGLSSEQKMETFNDFIQQVVKPYIMAASESTIEEMKKQASEKSLRERELKELLGK